mgnify:CR=1 FL=1
MNTTTTLKVDSKGRISLPPGIRKSMHINTGDIFFLQSEETSIHLIKAENPFDILSEDAVKQYKNGKTISLRKFAKKCGIKIHS